MNPIALTISEFAPAEEALPRRFMQAKRMLRYLAEHPDTSSGELTASCEIGNLSDIALRTNRFLSKVNLAIKCRQPPSPIANQRGKPSQMVLWGVYRTVSDVAS